MALIRVTEHAAKRFKQRMGIKKPNTEAKPLVAVHAMKKTLFKTKPRSVTIDGDVFHLSYDTSVEGEEICTIHTVIPKGVQRSPLKQIIKKRLMKWLNDW